jgi:predicted transcriptional regulator
MPKITQIMETVPYTCSYEATVGDVIRHLADVQVGGVPIVDGENRLVGYITDSDIMKFISHKKAKIYDVVSIMPVVVDEETMEEKVRDLLDTPVMNIANRKKLYARTDHEIDEVADMFKKEQVRKLAILENGKVVGVVTRSMIMRYILSSILDEE